MNLNNRFLLDNERKWKSAHVSEPTRGVRPVSRQRVRGAVIA